MMEMNVPPALLLAAELFQDWISCICSVIELLIHFSLARLAEQRCTWIKLNTIRA